MDAAEYQPVAGDQETRSLRSSFCIRKRCILGVSTALDESDKQYIQDTIIAALEQVVLPRFDEMDRRFDAIEEDIRTLKEDVRILKEDVRTLKSDMRQVKSDLSSLDGRV